MVNTRNTKSISSINTRRKINTNKIRLVLDNIYELKLIKI